MPLFAENSRAILAIDYGGANIARADFFELLGPIFFGQNMCADRA